METGQRVVRRQLAEEVAAAAGLGRLEDGVQRATPAVALQRTHLAVGDVEGPERLVRLAVLPTRGVQFGLLAQRFGARAREGVLLDQQAAPVERGLRRVEVSRQSPHLGEREQRQDQAVAVLAVGLGRTHRLEDRDRVVEAPDRGVGPGDGVDVVALERLTVRLGLGEQPLHRDDGLDAHAGLVLGEGEIVQHPQPHVPVPTSVGQLGDLLVSSDRVVVGAARAQRVGQSEQVIGADNLGRVGVEEVDGGDGVFEHQRRITDPAQVGRDPTVAAGEQRVLAVLLRPGLDLAHHPGPVLGLTDPVLGRTLDQQNGLVGDGVGLGAGGIEQFAGALQRNGGVLAQQLVELRHRRHLLQHVLLRLPKS